MPRPSLLVLALDGATFDVIRPLAAAGRLPNLAAWMEAGVAAPLPSTVPAMTFPAWSSFLTGLGPGEHGLFDFTQKEPGAYRVRFTNAADRRGASLFARVSRAGGSVLALGMPTTYPPEPVRGLLVSGFDAPVSSSTDASSASDPELYRAIAKRVGPWMRQELNESADPEGWHERAVGTLLSRIETKTAFALEALGHVRRLGAPDGPELAVVVFSESDTVAHHYWRDHDPASPRHDPGASELRRGAIAAVYERLDQACGEIRQAFGPEAPCVVISDHGFGGASRRVLHLNRYLSDCALLRHKPLRAGLSLDGAARATRDAVLRVLPPRAAQRIFRRSRALAARWESTARFAGLDWRHTQAFSEEANTQPGVWINLRGREAAGCVAEGDYERVRSEVIDALADWKLPGGAPVVARARRREDVYAGPCVERAPDIVVEPALDAGYGLSLVPTPWGERDRSTVRTLEEHELGGGRGRGMNGTHRPDGIWIAQGDAAPPQSIVQVAPRLLHAMGLAAPRDAEHDGDDPENKPLPYTPAEDEIVARRLRDLGYLE